MEIRREEYEELMTALDGIRANLRENKIGNDQRQISDRISMYIERKGYCVFTQGIDGKFYRQLTPEGSKALSYLNYGKYRCRKRIEEWQLWLPIAISIGSLVISIIALNDKVRLEQQINLQLKQSGKQATEVFQNKHRELFR